ncbi:MAG: hypothetical protein Q8R25_02170 [bacterium]|nr:hypothetical protein [bacterium]
MILATAFVGLILFVVVSGWNTGGWQFGLLMVALCIGGVILYELFVRYERVCSIIVAMVGLGAFVGVIVYSVMYGQPQPINWAGFLEFLTFMAIVCGVASALFIGVWLLKRLKFYVMICPTRPPSDAQTT